VLFELAVAGGLGRGRGRHVFAHAGLADFGEPKARYRPPTIRHASIGLVLGITAALDPARGTVLASQSRLAESPVRESLALVRPSLTTFWVILGALPRTRIGCKS